VLDGVTPSHDRPFFRPDVSQVGADRESVVRYRWSPLLAVGRCAYGVSVEVPGSSVISRVRLPVSKPGQTAGSLTCGFALERVTGIEPALSAWEADVLPLNYTRADLQRCAAGASCTVFAQTSYRNR
jgi:hypothetical protein